MSKTITNRLGFGLMRLPEQENGQIDEMQVEQMVNLALQNGINYFDTAYFYHNGESENVIGRVLSQKIPRENFILADKMPMTVIKSCEDVERIFDEQLKKCQVEYFDYYLLHALNANSFQKVKDFDVLNFVKTKQAQGKIKHLGFSFHDTAEVLEQIIAYNNWDFVQLQLNYYDLQKEDFKNQYNLAVKNNLKIIVMEPVRGGFLARTVPNAQKVIEAEYGKNKSASLALSYASSLPNVMLVLSGMSEKSQLLDNIKTFENPIKIDEKAKLVIDNVLEEISIFKSIDCTKCEYCMPCPGKLNIPQIFDIYNSYQMFKNVFGTKNALQELEKAPKSCINCKKCEAKCPQSLEIAKYMKNFAMEIEKM